MINYEIRWAKYIGPAPWSIPKEKIRVENLNLVSLTSGTLKDAYFLMGQQVRAMIPESIEPIFQVFSTKIGRYHAEQ